MEYRVVDHLLMADGNIQKWAISGCILIRKSHFCHIIKMPIYEYETTEPGKGCAKCSRPFEIIQGIGEPPLSECPECGRSVKKIISACNAAVMEYPDENRRVKKQIREYEKNNMWSHAAELADKHSERTSDHTMRSRALDNYKKAGYNLDSIEKDSKNDA